jgi:hypothetical protein
MNHIFEDEKLFPGSRIALGVDRTTGTFYVSCPFTTPNRMVDFEKYFSLTRDEYAILISDETAAKDFVSKCLMGQMDARLIHPKS